MSEVRRLWGELVRPLPATGEEPWLRDRLTERTRRGGAFDLAVCVLAFLLGLFFLSPTLGDPAAPLTHAQVVLDITGGGLAGGLLWWIESLRAQQREATQATPDPPKGDTTAIIRVLTARLKDERRPPPRRNHLPTRRTCRHPRGPAAATTSGNGPERRT